MTKESAKFDVGPEILKTRLNKEIRAKLLGDLFSKVSKNFNMTRNEEALKASRFKWTEEILKSLWTCDGVDYSATANEMPSQLFNSSSYVSVLIAKKIDHPDLNKSGQVRYAEETRLFHYRNEVGLKVKKSIPANPFHGTALVTDQETIDLTRMKINSEKGLLRDEFNRRIIVVPKKLHQAILEDVFWENKVARAKNELKEKISVALKQVRTVRQLKENWPEAFEIYCENFPTGVSGTALATPMMITDVRDLINGLPDSMLSGAS